MSALNCGCDPEANHLCDGHRIHFLEVRNIQLVLELDTIKMDIRRALNWIDPTKMDELDWEVHDRLLMKVTK